MSDQVNGPSLEEIAAKMTDEEFAQGMTLLAIAAGRFSKSGRGHYSVIHQQLCNLLSRINPHAAAKARGNGKAGVAPTGPRFGTVPQGIPAGPKPVSDLQAEIDRPKKDAAPADQDDSEGGSDEELTDEQKRSMIAGSGAVAETEDDEGGIIDFFQKNDIPAITQRYSKEALLAIAKQNGLTALNARNSLQQIAAAIKTHLTTPA